MAHPVLETTFLQHGPVKIALAVLACVWVLVGPFLVGMPYLHRDLLFWISDAAGSGKSTAGRIEG